LDECRHEVDTRISTNGKKEVTTNTQVFRAVEIAILRFARDRLCFAPRDDIGDEGRRIRMKRRGILKYYIHRLRRLRRF